MRGAVDRGFIHARIYGQFGRLLKRNDYELLARRQSPGEGRAGVFFKDTANISAATREAIFKSEIAAVQSILQKNKRYRKLLQLFLQLYEIENLKSAATRCFSPSIEETFWYDISSMRHFDRDLLEKNLSPEELYSIISDSHLKKLWRKAPPEDFPEWERSLEELQDKVLREGSEKFFGKRIIPEGKGISVFSALSMSMKRLTGDFLNEYCERAGDVSGESILPKAASPWYRVRTGWTQYLEETLKKNFPFRGIMNEEEIIKIEIFFHTAIWSYARKNIFLNFHSMETATSYLILRIYQIKNYFAVAEGLRLGRKPAKIMDYIIYGK